jgi:hypothetical protein
MQRYTVRMGKEDAVPAVPAGAPHTGEVYRHYKGDQYRVVGLALHSDETWLVVYEPLYTGAVSNLFTRPALEWRQPVEWQGTTVERFTLISG